MINFFRLINLIFQKQDEQFVAQSLIEAGKHLAIAESCTGGLVSSLLTDVSGSSAFIRANFVTYANEAKSKYLGVSEDTLKTYGAVSLQTATEMALGVLKETGAECSLVTTGIAGPTGGTDEKPVGTVYIGIARNGENPDVDVIKYCVNPKLPRVLIKYMFAKQAIKLLAEKLEEKI